MNGKSHGNDGKQRNDENHNSHHSHSSHKQRPIIPPRGDYQTLLSYQKAEVVYDITFRFAQKLMRCSPRKWKGIEPSRRLFSRHNGFEARDGHQIRVHFPGSPAESYHRLRQIRNHRHCLSTARPFNVSKKCRRIQTAACCFADNVFRRHPMANLMHVTVQPGQ